MPPCAPLSQAANVLLFAGWVAKVADFGYARMAAAGPMALKGVRYGVPYWMSPEMLSNNKFDASVDVYAFALLAWEVVNRAIPFEGFASAEFDEGVSHGLRPHTTKILTRYGAGLSKLVEQCWSDRPDERPTFETIVGRLEVFEAARERGGAHILL